MTYSEGAIIFGQSIKAEKVYYDFNGRLDASCIDIYRERHVHNPWSVPMQGRRVGQFVPSDDIFPLAQLRKTSFYDEVLKRQGIVRNGMIALAWRHDFVVAFNLNRTEAQGQFSSEDRRLMELLSPHLRRSVTLGARVDAYSALARAAFDTLDRIGDGVVVLDRRARIVFANAAARDLEAKGVWRLQSPLTTFSQPHTKRLAELVSAGLNGAESGVVNLPAKDATGPVALLVTSLRSREVGRLSDSGLKDAAALVFAIAPSSRKPTPIARIMAAYGLTAAEARVAVAASNGSAVSETARRLGVSPNTVKTHLQRVFVKMGVAGQVGMATMISALGAIRAGGD